MGSDPIKDLYWPLWALMHQNGDEEPINSLCRKLVDTLIGIKPYSLPFLGFFKKSNFPDDLMRLIPFRPALNRERPMYAKTLPSCPVSVEGTKICATAPTSAATFWLNFFGCGATRSTLGL